MCVCVCVCACVCVCVCVLCVCVCVCVCMCVCVFYHGKYVISPFHMHSPKHVKASIIYLEAVCKLHLIRLNIISERVYTQLVV